MPKDNIQRPSADRTTGLYITVDSPKDERINRKEKRAVLNSMVRCSDCGDRMLMKHLTNHVRRAMLHEESYRELKKQGVL